MLVNIKGCIHAYSIYLNMGYYNIEISPGAKQLCTIVLTWVKYENQKLLMGVCNSLDTFHDKISELFEGFDTVCGYI